MKLEKCRSPRINPRRLVCMQILLGRLLQFPFGACSLKSAARRCRPRATKGETKKLHSANSFCSQRAEADCSLLLDLFIALSKQRAKSRIRLMDGQIVAASNSVSIFCLPKLFTILLACCVCLLFLATTNTREIVFLRPLSFPLQHSHTSVSCVSVAKRATQRSKLFALEL